MLSLASSRGTRLLLVTTLVGSLAACVVAPAPVAVQSDPYYTGANVVYAPMAPPPPQYEVVPALPYPGAIWIGGYWGWQGGRHQWMPGHYERPRPGYRWQPHRWEPGPRGGWSLHGGVWVR